MPTPQSQVTPVVPAPPPLEKRLHGIRDAIERNKAEFDTARDSIGEIIEELRALNGPRVAGGEMTAIDQRLELEETQRSSAAQKMEEVRTSERIWNQEESRLRGKCRFPSIEAVQAEIARLQALSETDAVNTVAKEKSIVNEIQSLYKEIPAIRKSLAEVARHKATAEDFSGQLEKHRLAEVEARGKLQDLRKERKALQDVWRTDVTDRDERRGSLETKLKELVGDRNSAKEKMDCLADEALGIQEEHREAMEAQRTVQIQKKEETRRKTAERNRVIIMNTERQQLASQMEALDMESFANAEAGEMLTGRRMDHLINYCKTCIEKEQFGTMKSISIGMLGDFGEFGFDLPETKGEFEEVIRNLEPRREQLTGKLSAINKDVDVRRAEITVQIAELDSRIAQLK